MSSAAQIAANRINSQSSTGPTSEAGKSRASLNAVKTGLTGRTVLLPAEDAELYTNHIARFFDEYKPAGDEESTLVQSLADTRWRLARIPALEAGIYALGRMEYQDLFPQETNPDVRRHLIETKIYLDYGRQFNNLMSQEARLHRQEEKDRKRLNELQARRKEERSRRLTAAAKEYQAAVDNGKEADFLTRASEIGFEFSIGEIEYRATLLKQDGVGARSFQNAPMAANSTRSAA